MPKIFETFEKYIPNIYKRIEQPPLDALVAKINAHLTTWEGDIDQLTWLQDPLRCPSKFLNLLGDMLNAGIQAYDDDATKRTKITTAIQGHRRRGTFVFDAKPKIDAIAGGDSQIFQSTGEDDWILVGDGLTPTAFYWAALGVDGVDLDLGISLIGEGTEIEIAGNIYIDVDNDSLTADEVAQIVAELEFDIVPAYYIIYLGYIDGTGAFVVYAGGVIG